MLGALIVAVAVILLLSAIVFKMRQSLDAYGRAMEALMLRGEERRREARARSMQLSKDFKPIVDFHLGHYKAGSGLLAAIEKLQKFVREGLDEEP